MHLAEFSIENFKGFKQVAFELNADLNVLTGVNNSGKTTVLEALGLWAEMFRKLSREAGKGDSRSGLSRGQYRLGDSQPSYISPDQIQSVRSSRYGDIFWDLGEGTSDIVLKATLENDGIRLPIGFRLRLARGTVYEIKLSDKSLDLAELNRFFTRWPPINAVHSSPVAFIQPREEFETGPKIRSRVLSRASATVFRNRIYELKKDRIRFEAFCGDLAEVLFADRQELVEFGLNSDETTDVDARVRARLGSTSPMRDVSLLGSGTLQIIELLLSVHGDRRELNLVLLDEPDSHIHRDLQRRLLNALLQQTNTGPSSAPCQVFLTTHNEGLIRSTNAQHLFHLELGQNKIYRPIWHDPADGAKRGLQPSRPIKVLRSLGNESGLDLLNALESRWVVLVEGEDDARYIQRIVERGLPPGRVFLAMFWAFGGVGPLLRGLDHYRTGLFSAVRNQHSLWDRCAIVFDADHASEPERQLITHQWRFKTGYTSTPVFLWRAYTIEATILSDRAKLVQIVAALIRADSGTAAPSEVAQAVLDAYESLRDQKSRSLDEAACLKRIEGQRSDRFADLEILFPKGNKLPNGPAMADFLPEAKKTLNAGFVHHLTTKEEVADLIRSVYEALGLPALNEVNLFDRLIEVTTPATRPLDWDELSRLFS